MKSKQDVDLTDEGKECRVVGIVWPFHLSNRFVRKCLAGDPHSLTESIHGDVPSESVELQNTEPTTTSKLPDSWLRTYPSKGCVNKHADSKQQAKQPCRGCCFRCAQASQVRFARAWLTPRVRDFRLRHICPFRVHELSKKSNFAEPSGWRFQTLGASFRFPLRVGLLQSW